MKIHLVPAILAAFVLAGCASPAASTTPSSTPTSPAASTRPSASSSPSSTATNEPRTLREALAIAHKDHSDTVAALGAMEDLARQAKTALKPSMTATEWGDIEIIRINTGIGAMSDKMTDREVTLAVKEYAVAVEKEAIRQGKA